MCCIPLPRVPLVVLTVALLLPLNSCATIGIAEDSHLLQDRLDGSVLVFGCVIFDTLDGPEGPFTIIIKYRGPDHSDISTIMVQTDSLGYFALTNMPVGHYAVHAVQYAKFIAWYVPVESAPTDRVRAWRRVTPRSIWRYSAELGRFYGLLPPKPYEPPSWPEPEPGGIYNLKYTILAYDYSNTGTGYLGYSYSSLNGESFFSGRKYHRPRIPEYFIEKYPKSGWVPYLERMLMPPNRK